MTESSGIQTNPQGRAMLGLIAVIGSLVLLGLVSKSMLVVTLVIACSVCPRVRPLHHCTYYWDESYGIFYWIRAKTVQLSKR